MDRNGEKLEVITRRLGRAESLERVHEIAELRIRVFRDFPYIYDGSIEYEVKYLSRYFDAPNACFIGALTKHGGLVGVATCLPLQEEEDYVKKPFLQAGFEATEVFYFGESVLLPEYRGRGLGHQFFDEREKYAAEFSTTKYTTFCAVERDEKHPMRPCEYRPLDHFWQSRGYIKKPDLRASFEWKDIGEETESSKQMIYWFKNWSHK